MSKTKLFNTMRFCYVLLDRTIRPLMGERARQQFVRFAYRAKARMFPQYGDYVPELTSVRSSAENLPLIPPAIPEWVLEEMKDLGREVDPAIYPTPAFIAACQYYVFPVVSKPGDLYFDLLKKCRSADYTICFSIPWLKKGGADIVSLYHIRVAAQRAGAKVLVVMTEPGISPWMHRIPSNVDVLDVSQYVGKLAHEEIVLILARLVIQLRIKTLHVINSRHMWETVSRFGKALRQDTRIYASVFCDDYDEHGMPVGFARQYLPQCYKYLSAVFSDNDTFIKLLIKTYGYPPTLFKRLSSPIARGEVHEAVGRQRSGVLWAGRIDRQKRPDILLSIARAMPHVRFTVYGEPVLNQRTSIIDRLRKCHNVSMKGGFDGVEALPFGEHAVFLYTSQWDGIPTILLAAADSGIPIVASCVGGVGEVVHEQTGFPVYDIDNVEDYVRAIDTVLGDPVGAEERAIRARNYVRTEHVDSKFRQSLEAVQGYFSEAPAVNTDRAL